VHVSHRIGALFTFLVVSSLAIRAILAKNKSLKRTGVFIMLILFAQVSLGVANVLMALPLSVAVAHNAVAALLLLALITLLYFSFSADKQAGL
jgi:heme a synthase